MYSVSENSNQELDEEADETGFIGTDSSDSSDSCKSTDETLMNKIDAKANEILKQEFEEWEEKTYEELRGLDWYGYTERYLLKTTNFEEFSSSAEISTILKLAKLDLEK